MTNNYAIIENGKVVNAVVAEDDYAIKLGWILLPEDAGIDCDYIDGQFIDNRPKPQIVEKPAPTKEDLLAQLQALTQKIQAI
jgi:hypothetical protein